MMKTLSHLKYSENETVEHVVTCYFIFLYPFLQELEIQISMPARLYETIPQMRSISLIPSSILE